MHNCACYCSSNCYTVIGITHRSLTDWLIRTLRLRNPGFRSRSMTVWCWSMWSSCVSKQTRHIMQLHKATLIFTQVNKKQYQPKRCEQLNKSNTISLLAKIAMLLPKARFKKFTKNFKIEILKICSTVFLKYWHINRVCHVSWESVKNCGSSNFKTFDETHPHR